MTATSSWCGPSELTCGLDISFVIYRLSLQLTDAGEALLVKYVNAVDSANHVLVEGYNALLQHVGAVPGVVVPQPLQALSGADWVHRSCTVTDGSEQDVVVRALTWIEGETLSAYGSSAELLYSAGAYLGTLRQRLEGFNHPAFARAHSWDLKVRLHLSALHPPPPRSSICVHRTLRTSSISSRQCRRRI
jgi:Ser/Thr protein kinase RdoA (MazF antagonist)